MLNLSSATWAALEMDRVLSVVAQFARTDAGRITVLDAGPLSREKLELRRQEQADLEEVLVRSGPWLSPVAASVEDAREGLRDASRSLSTSELVRLAELLVCVARAARRLERECESGSIVRLSWLQRLGQPGERAGVEAFASLVLGRLDPKGELKADASPQLEELSALVAHRRSATRNAFDDYVGRHRGELADDTVTSRQERLVVLLPVGSKKRLQGLVHGRSSRGHSYYFEPLELVEPNNDLRKAEENRSRECARLINELYSRLEQLGEVPLTWLEVLAELDGLQAVCLYAQRTEATPAEISTEGEVIIRGATHPLLDPRLLAEREAALETKESPTDVVPLDFVLDEDRIAILTGPNAGGKTVALKTVGLVTLLAHCGFPVPARHGTRVPRLDQLVAVIGDDQDLLAHRSTFSGRLERLRELWEEPQGARMVLLDEVGTGTHPEEGAAIGLALFEGLLEQGAIAVMTTHLTELAAAGLETAGANCWALEFDRVAGGPTFRLAPGQIGGSEAVALARKSGMPEHWLERAERALGEEHGLLLRLINETQSKVRALDERLASAALAEREAEKARQAMELERATAAEESKQARTRLRSELESYQLSVRQELAKEAENIRSDLEQGRRRNLGVRAAKRVFERAPVPQPLAVPRPAAADEKMLAVGDRVRHRSLGWVGELTAIEKGRVKVLVRGKRLSARSDELERDGDKTPGTKARSPRSQAMSPASAEEKLVPSELNLIGFRVDDALEQLDSYLDQAVLSSLPTVRVIHGHGTGRLRTGVRGFLRTHFAVARHEPDSSNGATLVTLKVG